MANSDFERRVGIFVRHAYKHISLMTLDQLMEYHSWFFRTVRAPAKNPTVSDLLAPSSHIPNINFGIRQTGRDPDRFAVSVELLITYTTLTTDSGVIMSSEVVGYIRSLVFETYRVAGLGTSHQGMFSFRVDLLELKEAMKLLCLLDEVLLSLLGLYYPGEQSMIDPADPETTARVVSVLTQRNVQLPLDENGQLIRV